MKNYLVSTVKAEYGCTHNHIANLYSRRPDSLHTIYNEKTSSFTPEEARIVKDEIIVFTLNE